MQAVQMNCRKLEAQLTEKHGYPMDDETEVFATTARNIKTGNDTRG